MKSILCFMLAILATQSIFAQRHFGPITGYNVKEVEYTGRIKGKFVRVDGLNWREMNTEARFSFEEINRDAGSVYLSDKSRNYTVQIDLVQNKIYLDPLGKKTELYTITQAEVGRFRHITNGYNVNQVDYSGRLTGRFFRLGGNNWGEENNEAHFSWTEVRHDQWSVFLEDKSRNYTVELDLYQNKIFLDPYGRKTELYPIIKARTGTEKPAARGDNLKEVEYTGKLSGRFLHEGGKNWLEINNEAQFRFEEVKFDDWSVYLTDKTRNATVQLDLLTNKIYYDPFGKKTELYNITKVNCYQ